MRAVCGSFTKCLGADSTIPLAVMPDSGGNLSLNTPIQRWTQRFRYFQFQSSCFSMLTCAAGVSSTFIFFWISSSVSAQDADPNRFYCAHTVEGEINSSTVEQLEANVDSLIDQRDSQSIPAVCFDSRGGNLQDGLEIARLLNQHALPAMVLDDGECLSACAMAFLGGRFEIGMSTIRSRTVESGGAIGFHAPALTIGDGSYDADTVSASYALALKTISEVMRQRSFSEEEMANEFLLYRFLETPPEMMWRPDTVEDYVLSDISILLPEPYFANWDYINVCDNFVARYIYKLSDPGEMNESVVSSRIRNWEELRDYWALEDDVMVGGYWDTARSLGLCRISRTPRRLLDGSRGLAVSWHGYENYGQGPRLWEGYPVVSRVVPMWFGLPFDLVVN